ncbi:MAG: flagellar basal-body rod protein FlgG [Thermoleophilia bacterium]|nr:flagellar basal-body rod protein FlgG [Thermoleophilia bacterium]
MMNSLYTAATGMSAMQMNVDTIANNLANVNTNAFKATRLRFEDLLYQQVGDRQAARMGSQNGMGVAPARTELAFSQGDLKDTGTLTHMAIDGAGFFQVTLPDGTIGYTRDGSFSVDQNGQFVNASGYQLEPIVGLPLEAEPGSLQISPEGMITCKMNGVVEVLGELELARFANPEGLAALGSNVYAATVNSGEPIINAPGTNDMGLVKQGQLEGSNVSVMNEMVEMINAQRAFESVSKVISTSDEMLGIANSMRR